MITHSSLSLLGGKYILNKFSEVISLKIENALRWKLVHEIIESSFADRIMMIWQRTSKMCWYMCYCCKCQYQRRLLLFPPSTSFPKIGDQKVWQGNWFEITILRNVSFKFVNSSVSLSSINKFILQKAILL